MLIEQQLRLREQDTKEPPLFTKGDLLLLANKKRKKGNNPKLEVKFAGPYIAEEVLFNNHTYLIESQGTEICSKREQIKTIYTLQ